MKVLAGLEVIPKRVERTREAIGDDIAGREQRNKIQRAMQLIYRSWLAIRPHLLCKNGRDGDPVGSWVDGKAGNGKGPGKATIGRSTGHTQRPSIGILCLPKPNGY